MFLWISNWELDSLLEGLFVALCISYIKCKCFNQVFKLVHIVAMQEQNLACY